VHTRPGKDGRTTDHSCDEDGCTVKLGVSGATEAKKAAYGRGSEFEIDTSRPFEVTTRFNTRGFPRGLELVLAQVGKRM
jgi:hypothetical protein